LTAVGRSVSEGVVVGVLVLVGVGAGVTVLVGVWVRVGSIIEAGLAPLVAEATDVGVLVSDTNAIATGVRTKGCVPGGLASGVAVRIGGDSVLMVSLRASSGL
jgi:hypothetical protein